MTVEAVDTVETVETEEAEETVEAVQTVETVETAEAAKTVYTEDLKKYDSLTYSLTDNLKARDASASKKYEIFVHDPTFFTLNWVPEAFPFLYRKFAVDKLESHFYSIVLIEELNLLHDPCN